MPDRNERDESACGACPTPEALRRFSVGDLAPPELERAARHVEGCPACAEALEALGDPADALVTTLQHLSDDEPLPETALGWALWTPGAADGSTAGPPVTGDRPYRLLRPLARGGLGRVWIARDAALGREVALKEIRPELADDPGCRARFLREAEVTGRLEHPGIVPVYGLGADASGHLYYAMRLVGGETFLKAIERLHRDGGAASHGGTSWCQGLRPLLVRFVAACNAVAFAHSRAVLHRDLKPANILLGPFGETYVVDWGLASILGPDGAGGEPGLAWGGSDPASGSGETRDGPAMCTPAYASPEQAAGAAGRDGPAGDIFGLGATLYHLLTGRPPFRGQDPAAVLEAARLGRFDPPRLARPAVPRPLEAICLRAMASEPAGRYATPLDLAGDVERWLHDEPVSAFREPWLDRLARGARRNRAWTRSAAAALLAILGVSLVATLAVDRARRAAVATLGRERIARRRAEASEAEANRLALAERAARDLADRATRESRAHAAGLAADRGDTLLGAGEGAEGVAWLVRGLRLAPVGAAGLDRAMRADLAAWRAALPVLRAHLGHARTIWAVAISPDGSRVLTGGEDGIARLWDAVSGREVVPAPGGHVGTILAAAFAPDGRSALTAGTDGTARLWDVGTGRPLRVLRAGSPVTAAAFAPDGATVATGCDDGGLRLWDAATGEPKGAVLEHPGGLRAIAFSPDGRSLAAACKGDRLVRTWDLRSGRLEGPASEHPGEVHALAISPDGLSILAGCDDNRAYLWDRAGGHPLGRPLEHRNWVVAVAFAPDGRSALTAGYDNTARLWEVATGRPIGLPVQHPANLTAVAFGPGGETFATAALDGTVRVWAVPRGPTPTITLEQDGRIAALAFRPDGKSLATGTASSEERRGGVRAWQAASGQSAGEPWELPIGARALAFDPAGRVVATGHADRSIRLWEAATGRPIWRARAETRAMALALGPSGRFVLTGGWQRAHLRDAATGTPMGEPLEHPGEVTAVAFGPDGRWGLTGGSDHRIRLWDLDPVRLERVLAGPNGWITSLAVSTDGRTIAAGARDQSARLWDAATGAPLGEPLRHRGAVWAVAFSPDGRTLATGEDGAARLWDVATGRPLGPSLPHRGVVSAVAFRGDGRAVATGGEGAAHIWRVAEPTGGNADRLTQEAEAITGLMSGEGGALQAMDAATWEARRRLVGEGEDWPP